MNNTTVFYSLLIICTFGNASTQNHTIEIGHGQNAIKGILALNCSYSLSPGASTAVHARWVYKNDTVKKEELLGVIGLEKNESERLYMYKTNNVVYSTFNFTHKANPAEAGEYKCELFDNSNNVTLSTTIYQVVTSPVPATRHGYAQLKKGDYSFLRREAGVDLRTGENKDIECGAIGYPKPSVRWYRVKGTEDYEKLLDVVRGPPIDNSSQEHVSANGSTLQLRDARYEERGYYFCIANNNHYPPLAIYVLIRVKSRWAPLWPLLFLVGEVILLVLIIGVCEWRRKKAAKTEEQDRGGTGVGPGKPTVSFRAQNATAGGSDGPKTSSGIRQRSTGTPSKKGS